MNKKLSSSVLDTKDETNVKKKLTLKEKREQYLKETGGYLDPSQKYLLGSYVAKQLGITSKTLMTIAESGEFEIGKIGSKVFIEKASFMKYLDRYHFIGKDNDDDEPVFDAKGSLKKDLTYAGIKHDNVPELKKVEEFAYRIPLDTRSFIRHCDAGTFYHYRIGTAYKMSEEDFLRSIDRIMLLGESNSEEVTRSKIRKELKEKGTDKKK